MPTYDDTEREDRREDFSGKFRRKYPNGLVLSRIPVEDLSGFVPGLCEVAVLHGETESLLDIRRFEMQDGSFVFDQTAIIHLEDFGKVGEYVSKGDITGLQNYLDGYQTEVGNDREPS